MRNPNSQIIGQFVAVFILGICLITMPAVGGSCQSYKLVVKPVDPCTSTVIYQVSSQPSHTHTIADSFDLHLLYWAIMLLFGGIARGWSLLFCEKFIPKPTIPPPRSA